MNKRYFDLWVDYQGRMGLDLSRDWKVSEDGLGIDHFKGYISFEALDLYEEESGSEDNTVRDWVFLTLIPDMRGRPVDSKPCDGWEHRRGWNDAIDYIRRAATLL